MGRTRQLIQKLDRDIKFTNGPEGARDPPNLPACLSSLASDKTRGKDRYGFAQPPRRHAGLMDAAIVAGYGGRNVPQKGAGQALK
jgi:hypothetical protein